MKAKSENPAEYKVRIVGDDALIAEIQAHGRVVSAWGIPS